MTSYEYIIIGCGLKALAFADAVLRRGSAQIAIIDRHPYPGGHWCQTYSYAALTPPYESLGVESLPISAWLKRRGASPTSSPDRLHRDDVLSYCADVMKTVLQPTGRLHYFPNCIHMSGGRLHDLETHTVRPIPEARKMVDASEDTPPIPHQHVPCFSSEPNVSLASPFSLPAELEHAAQRHDNFCILGAGKAAVESISHLIGRGISTDQIIWVVPRDPWFILRGSLLGATDPISRIYEAMLAVEHASTPQDLMRRLEALGCLASLDGEICPTMFRAITISDAELGHLRQINRIIRKGHVHGISQLGMVFDEGAVPLPPNTLYIDCTAGRVVRAIETPIFQHAALMLQSTLIHHTSVSASVIGMIDGLDLSPKEKNRVCEPLSAPDSPNDILPLIYGTLLNVHQWLHRSDLRLEMHDFSLDIFIRQAVAQWDKTGAMPGALTAIRALFPRVTVNLERLMEQV
ncbi:MAG: FAD/NAD(P)-binding protein [Pseudomonadota bacterium]